jgi:hypothetical protein
MIFWTYAGEKPSEPAGAITPVIPPPGEEENAGEKPWSFFKDPLTWSLSPLLLFIVIVPYILRKHIADILWRLRSKKTSPAVKLIAGPAFMPVSPARARLLLPNGMEIDIRGAGGSIGRGDLARALGMDGLNLISRRHFEIRPLDEGFCIEDLGSANGTRLNDEDISGRGPFELKQDDVIQPASAISLVFHML